MPVQAVLDRNDMEQTIEVVQDDLAHPAISAESTGVAWRSIPNAA